MWNMFNNCQSLTSLRLDNFIIDNAYREDMFNNLSLISKSCTITIPKSSYELIKDQLTAPYITINFSTEPKAKKP